MGDFQTDIARSTAGLGRRAWLACVTRMIGGTAVARHFNVGLPLEQPRPVRPFRDPSFKVTDFGARPDGRTDATRSIQQTIDAAVDAGGGTVVFPPGASFYRLDGTVRMKGVSGIQLVAEGASRPQLRQTAANAILIHMERVKACAVSGLALRGRGRGEPGLYSANVYAPALYVGESETVTISGMLVEEATSNGIEGFNSSQCVIKGNDCRETALYNGIGWAGGSGNIFAGNRLYKNRGQGIEIRSQSDFEVSDNVSSENGDPSFNQSAGITVEAENGRIAIKNVDAGERVLLHLERPHVLRPSNRSVTIVGAKGMPELNGEHRATIIDSMTISLTLPRLAGKYQGGAELVVPVDQHLASESRNGRLLRNHCSHNNGNGIYIVAANGARTRDIFLSENTCTYNSLNGIECATGVSTQRFRDCGPILIERCELTNNGRAGLLLYFCSSVTIRDLVVESNRRAGVDVQASHIEGFGGNRISGNHPDVLGLKLPL